MIKANLQRPRLQLAIPIRLGIAQTKMPLTNDCCGIARFFQDRRQGLRARLDQRRTIRRSHARALLAKGERPGEQ